MYPKALNFITILPRGIFWFLFRTERKTTTIIDRNSVLNIYATASPPTPNTTIDTALNTTAAMTTSATTSTISTTAAEIILPQSPQRAVRNAATTMRQHSMIVPSSPSMAPPSPEDAMVDSHQSAATTGGIEAASNGRRNCDPLSPTWPIDPLRHEVYTLLWMA
jgi:hypothetical protein